MPHIYPNQQALTFWDDVGFTLNGKFVMVWFQHPRKFYHDAINAAARLEAGAMPDYDSSPFEIDPTKTRWKKLGRSRKKVLGYQFKLMSDESDLYFEKLRKIEFRLSEEGIDFVARHKMQVKRLFWCVGVELCVPVEVRSYDEACQLAALARRLLKGDTTIAKEFGGAEYGRSDWLAEASLRGGSNPDVALCK